MVNIYDFKRCTNLLSHFIGAIILLWFLTSEEPFIFVMVNVIAIIVLLVSGINIIILWVRAITGTKPLEYKYISSISNIIVALLIVTKWVYTWEDMESYMFSLAQDLREECIENGSCLGLRPE